MLGSWRAKAGVVAAGMLVGVLAVGTALAAEPQEPRAGHGKYADSFVTRLAGALGVDKTALVGAAKQAAAATMDEAVTNGDLNQTQAALMKERIQSGEFPGAFGRGGFHGGPGGRHGGMKGGEFGTHMAAVHQALATKLGMTPDQLKQEMMSGKTLHAIGQEKGVSDADLKATILGVAGPALEKAVQDGKLTQAQADQMLQKIQNLDLDQPMGHGGGHMPGHGRGHSEGRGQRENQG